MHLRLGVSELNNSQSAHIYFNGLDCNMIKYSVHYKEVG